MDWNKTLDWFECIQCVVCFTVSPFVTSGCSFSLPGAGPEGGVVEVALWRCMHAILTPGIRPSAITLIELSVMALGPNLIFGRPPVILPVKPHPCARTQPPAPFRKTVSVKLRFARPYWNKPVFSRAIRCRSRMQAKRNRHTLNFSPRDRSEVHNYAATVDELVQVYSDLAHPPRRNPPRTNICGTPRW